MLRCLSVVGRPVGADGNGRFPLRGPEEVDELGDAMLGAARGGVKIATEGSKVQPECNIQSDSGG